MGWSVGTARSPPVQGQEMGSGSSQAELRGAQGPGSRDQEQGTGAGNWDQGTGNRDQGAGSREGAALAEAAGLGWLTMALLRE